MVSIMANDTGDVYWDNLAGDNLACHPDNIAPGYEVACFVVTRIHASAYMLHALLFLYRAHRLVKLADELKRRTNKGQSGNSVTIAVPATSMATVSQRFRRRFEKLENASFGAKVSANAGISLGAYAISLYLGGPTAFSNRDIRGQLADIFGAIHITAAWYSNLLQLRGAKYFQSLVRFPGDIAPRTRSSACKRLPSPSWCLDQCHGRLGVLTAFILTVLQFTDNLSRVAYYVILSALTVMFGMRSFFAIITKRVSAMRRIAVLQNAAGGKAADKKRRQGTLKQKALNLVIDIVAVFISSCGVPLSYLVAGSLFSSRQYIMHLAVVLALVVCAITVAQVAMDRSLTRAARKVEVVSQVTRVKQGANSSSYASSQASGLSVVNQSVVDKQGPGLFSELG